MKIVINRKSLVSTLKALKTLSSKGTDERFLDVVSLVAQDGYLRLSAGTGSAFISVAIEAEIEEAGTCHSSFKLYELLKVVNDDKASLSFNKVLTVATESGLKARLTETTRIIPIKVLEEKLSQGTEAELVTLTEGLMNLVEISSVFVPNNKIRWMNITCDVEGQVYGTVEGSVFGELERLPLEGEGDTYDFTLRPDQAAIILSFCGERVKISAITNANGIYMITDPENDNWWAAIQRVDKPVTKQEN